VERRRGDEPVTHREMREAIQPLFDLKGRAEPPLRFWEKFHEDVEEYLPTLLEAEQVRQILKTVSANNWRKWRNLVLVVGGIYAILQVATAAIIIGKLVIR